MSGHIGDYNQQYRPWHLKVVRSWIIHVPSGTVCWWTVILAESESVLLQLPGRWERGPNKTGGTGTDQIAWVKWLRQPGDQKAGVADGMGIKKEYEDNEQPRRWLMGGIERGKQGNK